MSREYRVKSAAPVCKAFKSLLSFYSSTDVGCLRRSRIQAKILEENWRNSSDRISLRKSTERARLQQNFKRALIITEGVSFSDDEACGKPRGPSEALLKNMKHLFSCVKGVFNARVPRLKRRNVSERTEFHGAKRCRLYSSTHGLEEYI